MLAVQSVTPRMTDRCRPIVNLEVVRTIDVCDQTMLEDDPTPEVFAARVNPQAWMRGMYLAALWDHFDIDERDQLVRLLQSPPVSEQYHTFHEYPARDHALLMGYLARKYYRAFSLSEGIRLLSRHSATVFSTSKVGRVLLGSVCDPVAALRRLPVVLSMSRRGGQIQIEHVGDGAASVRIDGYQGCVESGLIGMIEGWLLRFEVRPRMKVEIFSGEQARITMTWNPPARA